MRVKTSCLSVIALIAFALCACQPSDPTPDASAADGGSWTPDTGPEPAMPDAALPSDSGTSDSGQPTPLDATIAYDAGEPPTPTEPDAGPDAAPTGSGLADLVVAFGDVEQAVSFRNVVIGEDDCELYEGCVGGKGARSLIELNFSLGNEGDTAIDLGRPFEDPLFYPSFCQDSYVIDGFFSAELRDEAGQVVVQSKLSTSCIAGDGGGYTCTRARASGRRLHRAADRAL